MNSIHDMGGMHGMGPLEIEVDEPVFHEDWERLVFALVMTAPRYGSDRFRYAIERMPPADYLRTSYFEHWLHGIKTNLVENGILTEEEISTRMKELEGNS